MRLAALFTAVLVATPAAATDYYISSFGHQYAITQNAHGAVLTSRYPTAWFIEKGANSRVETGIDKIYLSKDCDASHSLWGEGRWWWANGGFGVDFENGRQERFPRQEILGGFGLHCRL